jgi:hypothetical protein
VDADLSILPARGSIFKKSSTMMIFDCSMGDKINVTVGASLADDAMDQPMRASDARETFGSAGAGAVWVLRFYKHLAPLGPGTLSATRSQAYKGAVRVL